VCGRLLIYECDSKRVFMFDWGVLIRDQDYWYAERGCLFLFWSFPVTNQTHTLLEDVSVLISA
jgi:hypothetical protein